MHISPFFLWTATYQDDGKLEEGLFVLPATEEKLPAIIILKKEEDLSQSVTKAHNFMRTRCTTRPKKSSIGSHWAPSTCTLLIDTAAKVYIKSSGWLLSTKRLQ